VGGDIRQQLTLPLWDQRWTYQQQASVIGQAALSQTVPCAFHRQLCLLPSTDLDCTGTPCQDDSLCGGRSLQDGDRAFVALSWSRIKTVQRTPFLVHENVYPFPYRTRLLPHLPNHGGAAEFDNHPSHSGYGLVERHRQFVGMRDLDNTTQVHDPADVYDKLVQKMSLVRTTPRDIFMAD
jgi:hypothetical protein